MAEYKDIEDQMRRLEEAKDAIERQLDRLTDTIGHSRELIDQSHALLGRGRRRPDR